MISQLYVVIDSGGSLVEYTIDDYASWVAHVGAVVASNTASWTHDTVFGQCGE